MFQSFDDVKSNFGDRAERDGMPRAYVSERIDGMVSAERARGGSDADLLAYMSQNNGDGLYLSIEAGWQDDGRNVERWKNTPEGQRLAGANVSDGTRSAP